MFLPHVYIIATLPCVVRSQQIFSGMDELDQVLVDDIIPDGDVGYSETPYIAAVFNSLVKYQTCTGIIIQKHYVLAAGYCVTLADKVVDPMYVSVLAGVYDFRDREMDQWRYAVEIHQLHKTYNGRSVLALIKVNGGFFVNFSCGITHHRNIRFMKDAVCIAISWRFHDLFDRLTLKSLALKKHQGYIMNKTHCIDVYRSNPLLRGLKNLEFVCMNFITLPDLSDFDCMGADGSSLICSEAGVDYPAGIAISYHGTSKCNRYDALNVFLDIGAYHQWIDETIG